MSDLTPEQMEARIKQLSGYLVKEEERVIELQAQVKELEAYIKHLETEWVLTDDLDEARASWAALQESEL